MYTIHRQQYVYGTQTTMWSRLDSREDENINVLLQERSLECLRRTIERQDKADDE